MIDGPIMINRILRKQIVMMKIFLGQSVSEPWMDVSNKIILCYT